MTTLRRFRTADAAPTRQVFRAAIRGTAAAYYLPAQIEAWCPDEYDPQAWALARQRAWTIVAESSGRVVGFSDLTDADELDMLFVHPDSGGRGIARALVERVIHEAASRGLAVVSTRASRVARPVFERLGFEVDRENHDNMIRGVCVPNFYMHRAVGPISR